jgi:hypothetical protein
LASLVGARGLCIGEAAAETSSLRSLTPSACSGYYQIATLDHDKAYTYYYDARTGALIAIFAGAPDHGQTCVAGPRVFHPVDCPLIACAGATEATRGAPAARERLASAR